MSTSFSHLAKLKTSLFSILFFIFFAERARDHLHNLGTHVVVGGVISPVNDAYGKKDLASGSHRLEMLRLALRDSDWIRLSTWEMRQQGWTRTRASLQHHQKLLDSVIDEDNDDTNRNEIDNEEDLDWIPDDVRNNEGDDPKAIQIKLLCGGDLLESFATPGLWSEEDVSFFPLMFFFFHVCLFFWIVVLVFFGISGFVQC